MKTSLSVVALAALALLSAVTVTAAAKLPSSWKTCPRNDPNFDSCVKKNGQAAITELATKGAPSLKVYPIDPMRVDKLRLSSGSGSVALDLVFLNLDIYGFKDIRIDDMKADLDHNKLSIKATITSPLKLIGDYSVKGRLLVVPIGGAGRCNITLYNPLIATCDIHWDKRVENGRTYANVTKFDFTYESKHVKLYFHDKNHGDSQLSATLNKIANDNSAEILRDLNPAIASAFGQAFQEITNRVMSKIPLDELFPSK